MSKRFICIHCDWKEYLNKHGTYTFKGKCKKDGKACSYKKTMFGLDCYERGVMSSV
jgi:hypothetical protein